MHISQWQTTLGGIYPNQEMSPDYIMVHLSTKCSELSRIFNHQKQHYISTDLHVLKALTWLVALSNHFQIDYEKALISRFPGKCGYCLGSPCQCADTQKKAIEIRTGRELSQEEIDDDLKYTRLSYTNSGVRLSFDDFKALIFKIYPANKLFVYAGFYSFPLGKLDEEKGELHKAYSEYLLGRSGKEEIEVEIADVTAWLISFWGGKIHRKSIDAEMSSLIRPGCPSCKKSVCICPRYSITRSEEELIREIVRGLRSIKVAGLGAQEDVDQVISIAHQIRDENRPTLRKQFFSGVGLLARAAKQAPAATEGAVATAKNVESALEALKALFT